jgi:hypothetical protein
VSLSDIIQLFGTSGVPFVVAGTVYGVFELGEKLASQRAKDALSKWLLTFDVQKAKALPDGTREIFERVFGERHFSLKCFLRSAAFSLGAIGFLTVLNLLIFPRYLINLNVLYMESGNKYGLWLIAALWIPWSIIIDYISLFKTRVILNILTRVSAIISIFISVIDFLAYQLLFYFGSLFTVIAWFFFNLPTDESYSDFFALWDYPSLGLTAFKLIFAPLFPPLGDFTGITFWAGFVPSLWMWLYVVALFVTRALLRSGKLINWLRWFFDVEKNPFRSIGAVAAALAFIATVTILLVSAEVSRIGAAA